MNNEELKMKYVCNSCGKLIEEKDVIIKSYGGITFLHKICYEVIKNIK